MLTGTLFIQHPVFVRKPQYAVAYYLVHGRWTHVVVSIMFHNVSVSDTHDTVTLKCDRILVHQIPYKAVQKFVKFCILPLCGNGMFEMTITLLKFYLSMCCNHMFEMTITPQRSRTL